VTDTVQRRPTEEQNAEYTARWRLTRATDPSVRGIIATGSDVEAMFRNIYITGWFLDDCLAEIGVPDAERESICFNFGRMCFGRTNLWELFDRVYPQAVERAELLARRKDWAGISVPQEIPPPTALLTGFLMCAKNSVGEEGVFPLLYHRQAADGGVTIEALAISGAATIKRVATQLAEDPPVEFVFAVDMSAKPDQGIEFQDFLAVVWYINGQFLTGVINYEREGVSENPAFREIDWNNNYWNHGIREQFIPQMQAALGSKSVVLA
jgi:hypothetical protein